MRRFADPHFTGAPNEGVVDPCHCIGGAEIAGVDNAGVDNDGGKTQEMDNDGVDFTELR